MAKPMLVALPFLMLLLDHWPLKRFEFEISGGFRLSRAQRENLTGLVREKIPFFIITAGACVLAYFSQKGGGIGTMGEYPLYSRIANALISYTAYMGKMIWPFRFRRNEKQGSLFPRYRRPVSE